MQVAKRLCQGESIPLSHEDKSAYPQISPDKFPDIVRDNFYAFQGNCADGILDNGSDTVSQRIRKIRMNIQGRLVIDNTIVREVEDVINVRNDLLL